MRNLLRTPLKAITFVLLLSCLLSIHKLAAQTDITIGSGTVGNGNTGYPCPIQDYFEGSRAQFLYRASELTAAGMSVGFISQIKFNVTALNSFAGSVEQQTIRIGTSSLTTLNLAAWENVPNTVYGPTNYVPTVGINTFSFSAPFYWNGVDNIIIEICNGDPTNSQTGVTTWTENITVTWTTGLAFNGSHNYRADNIDYGCGTTTTTSSGTATTRPNIVFAWTPAAACSGQPVGGTATASLTNITCAGTPTTMSLTGGATVATGLTYQWQSSTDNVSFTNVASATNSSYTVVQTLPTVYYRCIITCTASGLSATSASVLVNSASSPAFKALPYYESFETNWINGCGTNDIPNASWKNTPFTGNSSWRRNDDGATAAWTTPNNGAYTPTGSDGNFSARFHSANATANSTGDLDMYINCSGSTTLNRLRFDAINQSASDTLVLFLSTDGGTNFTRLDSVMTPFLWRTKTLFFNSNSATTVLRFRGYSDAGASDFGIDNIQVNKWANCSGTPVGGTATATPGSVCLGEPVNLIITGATDGNGISYQWQVSTNSVGGPFVNIPGATNPNASTIQGVTSFYRCQVTCSFGGATAFSSVATVVSPPLPNGSYTINKTLPTNFPTGTNFNSFNDAYNAIKCGINGNVVFNVVAGTGPYNEQLIIDKYIPGSSPSRTITFNGNGNTLTFNATNTNQRAVVKLTKTNWFIFRDLVIEAGGGTFGYGFHLTNDADSNIIRKCIINTNTSSSSANYAGIVISGSNTDPIGAGTTLCDANEIDSCTINGGLYGVTVTATFSGGANGFNKITNNVIRNFHETGIYVAGSYNTTVEANTISRPTRTTVGNFTGILFTTQQNNNAYIARNRILNPFGAAPASTATFTGINFNNAGASAGNDNYVINNLIALVNGGTGSQTGLGNTSSSNMYYFHNTISLDDSASTATSTTRGYSQTGTAASVLFYNNLITIRRGGNGTKHCINVTTLPAFADNNNYFMATNANNHIGFFSSNRTTLANWKAAIPGQELLSLSLNPVYLDPANGIFSIANGALDDRGVALLPDDIDLRPRTGPDIGCWEAVPPPCSLPPVNGVTQISVSTICQNQPVYLNLNIGAFGSGQTFQWQYATNAAGPYTNLNPVATKFYDTTIFSTQTYYFRNEIKCATQTVYSNPVLLTVNPAFVSGTYTINNTLPSNWTPGIVGGNFQTFTAAKNAMMQCGVVGTGNIIFQVQQGPYNEQLKLDSIPGVNANRRVIFKGNQRTLAFSSSTSAERAVIKLNAADHITFDSLVVDATGVGTFGVGVQMINNADSNVISNCTINTNTTSTSTNYAGIVLNSADAGITTLGNTNCDDNVFDRNKITGGWCGISLTGSASNFIQRNRVTRNKILDWYNNGIYVAGTRETEIDSNFISRPTRTTVTAANGIQFTAATSLKARITKNRLTRFFGGAPTNTSGFNGIVFSSVDATAGNENFVINNLIYNTDGAGVVNGFVNVGSDNVRYYHNTVSIDNNTSTSTSGSNGFSQSTAAIGLDIRNNIFTITRGGTGTKYCLNFATNTTEFVSNWNNFFINAGGTNNHIGFLTANRTTLAAWQTNARKDTVSLNFDPIYTDSANGNFMPQMFPLNDKGTNVTVLSDIVNATRSTTTPDIGAWEFAPPPCASPVLSGSASVTPNSGACLEVPVRLNLAGHSPIGQIGFQWQHAPSASGPWTNVGPLLYQPIFDTVSSTNNFYRCIVTCLATGVNTTSNTVSVALNPLMAGGTYTINSSLPLSYPGPPGSNFQTMQQAVNALLCGITGSVIFNVTGTYIEQIRIPNVPGTSSSRTVTFQSATGIFSGAELTFPPSNAAQNYTLNLDSCRYIIFKNMTIANTSTTFGRVVSFGLGASYDSLINCRINAVTTTSTANTMAAVYLQNTTAASNINNITIQGNNIYNGSIGIFYSGFSAAALASPTNLIDGNTINGAYINGIQAQFANRLRLTNNTVNVSGTIANNANGIFTDYADSASRISGNTININSTTVLNAGFFVRNTRALATNRTIFSSNKVIANTGNTSTVYGIYFTSNNGLSVLNNTIAINSAGTIAYGIYHLNNTNNINYYNNSSQITAASTSGYAGYFVQAATGNWNVQNNIFSNRGGAYALYVNNPGVFVADYNMLFTSGTNLVQTATGTPTIFTSLAAWKNAWNWDKQSLVFAPAFVSNTDLRPDVGNANSWAMNGRAGQIKGNNFDFSNNYRPDSLTAGVPDFGAYEFYPTVPPPALNPTPMSPTDSVQYYMMGTDTVMKMKWLTTPIPASTVQLYSGDVPVGLPRPRPDSMFFYIKVNVPSNPNAAFNTNLYYVGSWLGSIPNQQLLGIGRTTPSNAWVIGFNSVVDVAKQKISQENLAFPDRFTGLINITATPVSEDSNSNRGKDFWVGYQRTNGFTGAGGGGQEMVLYFGAGAQNTNVTVEIPAIGWVRNYLVPANSAIASDFIPKDPVTGARLVNAGLYQKHGIHITADKPIVAYAHIYEGTNSGATMLMPTSVWGYEHYTLSSRQNYTSTSYAVFHIVANNDSTFVDINPSANVQNGWVPNGGPFGGNYRVKLNKGDCYQVLGTIISGSEGVDLSGSYVKSVANNQGQCFPIAVFSGSTRTGIGCGTSAGSSGDLIIQQIFPYQAWGTKYLTAPTSNDAGPNASSNMTNIYRVLVKDPATIVKRNNVVLTGIINNRYYQYESNTPDYIETNKPVLLAQFMSSSGNCSGTSGDGDPEMFYISPVEQAVKTTQFYRNDQDAIDLNFITLVIPNEGLSSLKIDGINYLAYPVAERFVYPHSQPGYSVVSKRWATGTGSSTVTSDMPFTGVVYGLGSVESYGYNLGTLVKNLNNLGSGQPISPVGAIPTYTCRNTPTSFTLYVPIVPDSIRWAFTEASFIKNITADSIKRNPGVGPLVTINGVAYYTYTINTSAIIDTVGIFGLPVYFWSQEIESCDKMKRGIVYAQVLPAPIADFKINYPGGGITGCEGDVINFVGDIITQNGIAVNNWNWTFNASTNVTGQNQNLTYPTPGTYPVKLVAKSFDGCFSDTTKNVVINLKPVVNVASTTVATCPGTATSVSVASPVTGTTYNWYNAATGGTVVGTGSTLNIPSAVIGTSYWVEGVANGCNSLVRSQVTLTQLPTLATPVLSVTGQTTNSVTFSWAAVANATGYQVSVNGGAFINVTTGTTYTVTGLTELQSVSVVIKARGTLACQDANSLALSGCTNYVPAVMSDSVSVCVGLNATLVVNPVIAGITYNWFTAASGGTSVNTGSSYAIAGASTTNTYFVEGTRGTCTSLSRQRVKLEVFPLLAVPVVRGDTISANTLTWTWTAIPGAVSYEVSLDNGTTWTSPSSGSTGTTHVITGQPPATTRTLLVRANGTLACQRSVSLPTISRTVIDEIFIPNVFTPNGDGRNDVLRIYGYVIKEMQFLVYNQWGEKVFESRAQSVAWDGTYKGTPLPVGVYAYVCKIVTVDGKAKELKGMINLIR